MCSAIIEHVLPSKSAESPDLRPSLPPPYFEHPAPSLPDCDFPAEGDLESAENTAKFVHQLRQAAQLPDAGTVCVFVCFCVGVGVCMLVRMS